jgi:hypothetical protein
MISPHSKLLLFCCLTLLTLIAGHHSYAMTENSTAAENDPKETLQPALPVWRVLEFEQKAFWATAKSRIEVNPSPDCPQQWLLSAASSVASNSEQVELTLAAADGSVLKRSRLSSGKNQRYKWYEYRADYILRERRVPEGESKQSPGEWALRSRHNIDYPAQRDGAVITNAYALLVLAERFLAGGEKSRDVVVHTDFNFYQVQMTRGTGLTIDVGYQINGDKAVSGPQATQAITLQASPLGTLAEKPDFSLLGLHGRITLLFDPASGLLLQLRGTAPRLGPAEINLKTATLREPPA